MSGKVELRAPLSLLLTIHNSTLFPVRSMVQNSSGSSIFVNVVVVVDDGPFFLGLENKREVSETTKKYK